MPITIPHNRLDLWYDSIQTFFKIIFLTINFGHFKPNFGHICPVQVNGGNFQVQDYVSKISLNFSLENMFCFIFWPFLFFHPFGSQTRLESWTLSYKTCSILSWGVVPLKVVWKPVSRKVPDLRHSMSMAKMRVIYTAWTFSRTCFFFFCFFII